MRFFDGAAVDAALAYPGLVDILQAAFRQGAIAPLRHHHAIALAGRPEATLLLMPAWEAEASGSPFAGRHLGVKTVTVFPDNAARAKPAVFGTYLLLSAETGETLAVMDATRLTAWRTGAASALASRYLSRADASRLLMVGAGALAPHLVAAHASVRPIREVALWNRSPDRARALVPTLAARGLDVSIAGDLEAAVRRADIVSAATISAEPLIRGAWLAPGTHVDCVGAYKPSMRETDDAVVRRARIFVDTRPGAFAEAGDIVQPLQAGVIDKEAILGDLFDLTRGTVAGRQTPEEITFFKSVGAAIEDLAAAIAVYSKGEL
jgi:ornithine cyclodeaminase/alanine dehydrogenase-like protein (mu-crystallin family)